MRTRWFVLAAVVLIALAGTGYYFYSSRTAHTPSGQPPIAELNDATLRTLAADFNGASGGFRVLLLLSPT